MSDNVKNVLRPQAEKLKRMANAIDEAIYLDQELSADQSNQLVRARKAIRECREKLIRIGHERTFVQRMCDDIAQNARRAG
ncbi:MAG: hypothetical protein AAFR07_05755 [Pseudomonadota bacterium]